MPWSAFKRRSMSFPSLRMGSCLCSFPNRTYWWFSTLTPQVLFKGLLVSHSFPFLIPHFHHGSVIFFRSELKAIMDSYRRCHNMLSAHQSQFSIFTRVFTLWPIHFGRKAELLLLFFPNLFIWKTERDREIFHLMVHSQMPATVRAGPGQIQEPRIQLRCPMWVAGPQMLESSPFTAQNAHWWEAGTEQWNQDLNTSTLI